MKTPRNKVDFKYLRTLLRVEWCCWVGLCMKWESLLTVKLMSGLISERYWKEPTIFLNSWGSKATKSSVSYNATVVDNSVMGSFAPSMFILWSISMMYLCWDRKKKKKTLCSRHNFLKGSLRAQVFFKESMR